MAGLGMSMTVQVDPVDRLLDAAQDGRSIITDRNVLRFTHIPDTIWHRDPEQERVTQSLLPILKQSRPSNLLIYGKTGTGKTLVARKVLSKIQRRVEKTGFPIRLVYANSKEETVYGLLVRLGVRLGVDESELPETGLAIPEVFRRILAFVEAGGINAVLVIDEIDHLAHLVAKSRKDVLYQLTRANERLARGSVTIVGISNDLAFKERLDPRVISALGEEEIVFANYTAAQIAEILRDRAAAAFAPGAVTEPALNLCAAMAGGEHGDARRAIDLLRVAGETAERRQAEGVTEEHVREASRKIEEDKETAALRSYPLHEKLVVLAVMRAGGTSTGEIYASYRGLARAAGQKELTQRRVTQMLGEIEMAGLVSGRIVHQGIHGRTKRFRLCVAPETVRRTFAAEAALEDIV